MRNCIYSLILVTILLNGGCKDTSLELPPPPNTNDFTLSPPPNGSASISFQTDRSKNVVYVGEQFLLKVVLYNMPDSLFAALVQFNLPNDHIKVKQVVKNPLYIGSDDSTVHVALVDQTTLEYGVVFRRTSISSLNQTPMVQQNGVLINVLCEAVSAGTVVVNDVSVVNELRVLLRSSYPFEVTTQPLPVEIAPLTITVSDEFSPG